MWSPWRDQFRGNWDGANGSSSQARRIAVAFDSESGLLSTLLDRGMDKVPNQSGPRRQLTFEKESAEDRFVVLPTGDYDVLVTIAAMDGGKYTLPLMSEYAGHTFVSLENCVESLFYLGSSNVPVGTRASLHPGQNTWALDRVTELFEPARKKLAELKASAATAPAVPRNVAGSRPTTVSESEITTLQLRFATGKPDGPPPENLHVKINGLDLLNKAISGTKQLKTGEFSIDFGELLPGEYSFDVSIGTGIFAVIQSHLTHTVSRGKENTLKIVCPPEPKEMADLKLEFLLPADLKEKSLCVLAQYEALPFEFAGNTWDPKARGTALLRGKRRSPAVLTVFHVWSTCRTRKSSVRGIWRTRRAARRRRCSSFRLSLSCLTRSRNKEDFGGKMMASVRCALRYRLVGVVMGSDPRNAGRRVGPDPIPPGAVFVSRKHDDENWPKSLDEPFEFDAGKVWKIDVPEEMLKEAPEQLAKMAKASDKPADQPPPAAAPEKPDPAMSLRIDAQPASPYGGASAERCIWS